jgi:transcriptional regulator with PAS, ATPase and Fis domain
LIELKGFDNIYKKLSSIAGSDLAMLIQGESGTGKEHIAHECHMRSARKTGKFVLQNCAAIPDSLIESELFGHSQGAFTGASFDHPGLFEMADGGTLFLDEIGDLSLAGQSKILRVIEDRQVRRIGSRKVMKSDFRLISATNKNLTQGFRPDLLYRIAEIVIQVPPLREHPEDILRLCNAFIRELNLKTGQDVAFPEYFIKLLENELWPGNIRQLKGVVRENYFTREWRIETKAVAIGDVEREYNLNRIIKATIEEALKVSNHQQHFAARLLGISTVAINRKIKKFNINWRNV